MFLHEDEKLFRRIIEDTKKEIQLDYEINEVIDTMEKISGFDFW